MKKVIISQKDLIHNISMIKEKANENGTNDNGQAVKIIAVVKGNGYGLGIVEYTKFLIKHGFDFFAVATVEEAITLRQAKIEQKILILTSTCIEEEIEKLTENHIIMTIDSKESAKMLNEFAFKKGKKIDVHLKIDTGMGRYGFIYSNPEELIMIIKELTNINIEGTFSHFSRSFSAKKELTEMQFKRFIQIVEMLKKNGISYGMLHICNSEAFLRYNEMHLNAVRVGGAFLGRTYNSKKFDLKVVGKLVSKIVTIKTLPKGYNIGYGNTYTTKRETKIAVVPIGYSDGVNVDNREQLFSFMRKIRIAARTLLKNENLIVNIAGLQYKTLGQVGMNFVVIDITGTNIEVGQEVVFNTRPVYINSNVERIYI